MYLTEISKYNILLFSLFILGSIASAQNSEQSLRDSIINRLENQKAEEKLASIKFLSERFSLEDPKLVLKYIDEGIALSRQLERPNISNNLFRYRGTSKSILGDKEGAFQSLNTSMSDAVRRNDSLLITKSANALGDYYNRLGSYKTAEKHYGKAVAIALAIEDDLSVYSSQADLATIYMKRGLYQKAISTYNSILKNCPDKGIDCNGAKLNKAICMYSLGKPSEGLDLLFEVKEIDLANEYLLRVQYTNHHIAFVLESVGLYTEAIEYYNEVLSYFSEQGDITQQISINATIGGLFLRSGIIDDAKIHFLEALRLQNEKEIKTDGRLLTSLGIIALKQNNQEAANTYFNRAEVLLSENKDKTGVVSLFLGKADLYSYLNNLEKSKQYVKKALFISKKLQLVPLQIDAYKKLELVFEKQQLFKEAIATKDTIELLSQRVEDKDIALEINRKLVQAKLSKNKNKISTLEKNIEHQSYSKNVIIIAISFIFLIVLIGILFFNRRKLWRSRFAKVTSKLDKNEASNLVNSLETLMETKQPYLDENITLIQLADMIPTTQKKLSIVLNTTLNTNFYDYINKYRVANFKEIAANPFFKHYSILGMASECGFKSKSSFYRAFKRETGQSPGEYKKNFQPKKVS